MDGGDIIQEHSLFYGMNWFGAFRNSYDFTWYGDNRTAVTVDFAILAVAYFCILIAVATLISTLGIRGRERWSSTLRASYAVGIGSIILVCIVGHNWMEGSTEITTQYLYRSQQYFRGTVGLRVALHGINVTLQGHYGNPQLGGYVYYAEDLRWSDYGKEPEQMNHFLDHGLPHPILTVMEFLSVDEGGLRWGRNYHTAGYFATALLWTAFTFWIITNVLLLSVVYYGAFMFFLTGVAMVLACIVYHVNQPPHDLCIYFGNAELVLRYGWCFWLMLAAGILTTVLGFLLCLMDNFHHAKVSEFFNLETLDEDDLCDGTPCSSSLKVSEKSGSTAMLNSRGTFVNGQRLGGQVPGQRRGSIFLEPERRHSDFTLNGSRKNGLFSSHTNFGFGISNVAFESDRTKSNPIFCTQHSNIKEELEEADKQQMKRDNQPLADIVIEMDADEAMRNARNRKPSLATMREHRENHINERQQRHSARLSSSASDNEIADSALRHSFSDNTISASVMTQCPSGVDVLHSHYAREPLPPPSADNLVEENTSPVSPNLAVDSSFDSAVVSGCVSPFDSDSPSANSVSEEQRL